MPTLLDRSLLDQTLEALPGWSGDGTRIWREVHLPKELDAQLRDEVATDARSMGHHVDVEHLQDGTRFSLTTAEVDGVSELDIALASRISDLAHRLRPSEPGVEAVRADDDEVVDETGQGASGTEGHDLTGTLLYRR